MNTFDSFFSPRGVAVIGASQDPAKLGHQIAYNLVQSGYGGAIHLINPKGGALLGHVMYHNVIAVPDPVDLAVILIPAPSVPQALRECAERGIRAVIIASGGFRETGPQGADLEAQCLEIAREHGIRLIGPNCIGLLDAHLPLDTTFLTPPGPLPGDIAFLSHSGAICAFAIDWSHSQNYGLSRLISLGNQADITESDMLAPLAMDPNTKVITLYLEGVKDGRKFIEEAQKAARQKPVLAFKAGRSASGKLAAASHTGAMTGSENAYNAAFRRSGVMRADSLEDLLEWAYALAWIPMPHGRSVAILTCAGGLGVIATDALEAQGLQLARLQETTHTALQKILPPAASLINPVDMLASATAQQYAACLEILLADPGVDSVLLILLPPPMQPAVTVTHTIIPIIQASEKPVVVAVVGKDRTADAAELLQSAHIPQYDFPERAVSALAILSQRTDYLARPYEVKLPCTAQERNRVQNIIESWHQAEGQVEYKTPAFLPVEVANRILESYGIHTASPRLAQTKEQAIEIAKSIGFPVALKVASPDIPHKSDVGGVLLDVQDVQGVADGFDQVIHNAHTALPQADLQGVNLQRMASAGQEVILGCVRDAQFGPIVMFGSGGVEVEGLKDVAFALAPLTLADAHELLDTTWAGRKLNGFRHLPPADRTAVLDTMLRMAQLATDFPQIYEMEINPLRVLLEGEGVIALDIRINIAPG